MPLSGLCQARERALLPMLSLCVSFLMGMVKLKEMMLYLGIRKLMEDLASKIEREGHDAKDKDIEYFDSSLAAVRRHAICVKISMVLDGWGFVHRLFHTLCGLILFRRDQILSRMHRHTRLAATSRRRLARQRGRNTPEP